MALGTIGGKIGFILGPILAVPAMFYSVDWFPLTEDTGPWYALAAWLLLGVAFAIAAGLSVRSLCNRLLRIKESGL